MTETMLTRIASASLLALSVACVPAALSAADEMNYTNVPKPVTFTAPDLLAVEKARFFVSADNGKSWTLASEMPVAADGKSSPRFDFRPQSDGVYIIATQAIWRNKSSVPDKEPQPGSVKSKAIYLTVDTFKPVIGSLAATLDKATPDRPTVQVTWSTSDEHFGADPVAIEASGDNGVTWPLSFPGKAQDSVKITVPVSRDARAVQIRLVAKDLAGNVAASETKLVPLPAPPDPALELKKAVTSLPSIAEIEPPAKTATPAAAAQPPVAAADHPLQIEPATASADPSRPDIIAPNADQGGSAADGALVAEGNVEAEYNRLGSEDAPQIGFKPERRAPPVVEDDTDPTDQPADQSADDDTPFIPNPGAEVVLEQAREQVKSGDHEAALATYRRLHNSGQARVAIAEELALLQDLGEQRKVVDTVAALPPEAINDAARLREGRALIALSDHAQALTELSRVHAGAPEAREAMYLIARSFSVLGRAAEARKVFATLAKGDDEWATKARQEHQER